jgi:hypothetical protein
MQQNRVQQNVDNNNNNNNDTNNNNKINERIKAHAMIVALREVLDDTPSPDDPPPPPPPPPVPPPSPISIGDGARRLNTQSKRSFNESAAHVRSQEAMGIQGVTEDTLDAFLQEHGFTEGAIDSDWKRVQNGIQLTVKDPMNRWHGVSITHYTTTRVVMFQGSTLAAGKANALLRQCLRGSTIEQEKAFNWDDSDEEDETEPVEKKSKLPTSPSRSMVDDPPAQAVAKEHVSIKVDGDAEVSQEAHKLEPPPLPSPPPLPLPRTPATKGHNTLTSWGAKPLRWFTCVVLALSACCEATVTPKPYQLNEQAEMASRMAGPCWKSDCIGDGPTEEYVVTEILSHRNHYKTLQFQAKYEGFEEPEWQDYFTFKYCDVVVNDYYSHIGEPMPRAMVTLFEAKEHTDDECNDSDVEQESSSSSQETPSTSDDDSECESTAGTRVSPRKKSKYNKHAADDIIDGAATYKHRRLTAKNNTNNKKTKAMNTSNIVLHSLAN